MESSLHRQLKEIYADGEAAVVEAPLGSYRIDVVADGELIEIQHGSLSAIRDKVTRLLNDHNVLVVKPIVHRKLLIKQDAKGGSVLSRRLSPKCGSILDLFEEMVYFTRVFPHQNLRLEVPLVNIEELRYPGHGRRRRRRERDHQVEDQRLTKLLRVYRLQKAQDLWRFLPEGLPVPFHTGHLAEAAGVARSKAQQIAYCLRETGAAKVVGKQGNAVLYQRVKKARAKSSKPRRRSPKVA